MKRKVLFVLFISNSILILWHLIHTFFDSEAKSIGIIGGIDGPTAVFVTSKTIWFPVLVGSLEIILGIWLLLTHFRKK